MIHTQTHNRNTTKKTMNEANIPSVVRQNYSLGISFFFLIDFKSEFIERPPYWACTETTAVVSRQGADEEAVTA